MASNSGANPSKARESHSTPPESGSSSKRARDNKSDAKAGDQAQISASNAESLKDLEKKIQLLPPDICVSWRL